MTLAFFPLISKKLLKVPQEFLKRDRIDLMKKVHPVIIKRVLYLTISESSVDFFKNLIFVNGFQFLRINEEFIKDFHGGSFRKTHKGFKTLTE